VCGHGTRTTFKPDPEIFGDTQFDCDTVAERLRELAFLAGGLRIVLRDEREEEPRELEFHYTGGINPSEAGAMKSVRYVALVAAGGMTNLWGAAVVSTFLNFLSLRGWFGSYDNAVFGVILISIMVFAPEGPFKPLGNLLRWFPGRWFAGTRSDHGAA